MEEKKPNFLKPMIIAACVLASFALFYFGMQYFANNKPAEIPSTAGSAPVATAPDQVPEPNTTSEPDSTTQPANTSNPVASSEPTATPEPQKELTFQEAMDLCQNAAIKHLGEGTMILPDFEGAMTEVTYDGKTRNCYVFIGGNIEYFLSSVSADPPARYCVDVTSGEVFDAISKKYIK